MIRSPATLFRSRSSARWPWFLDLLVVATAGGLHGVSFSAPTLWWFQVLAVAVLAWRCAIVSPRRAGLLGWAFGAAWMGLAVWWLSISMHQYGHLPLWMAWAAVASLCAALALPLGLMMNIYARSRRGQRLIDALLFAACWTVAELMRGQWFSGFPWAAAGYAHVESPLSSLAPWIGVYGIGAVAALLAALGVYAFTERHGANPAFGTLALSASTLLGLALWGGGYHTRPGPTLHVTLLQTNVAQDIKFDPQQLPATLEWVGKSLAAATGDLVVGPETVFPVMPEQLPPDYWEAMLKHFRERTTAALFGVPLGNDKVGYTNSVLGVSAQAMKLPGGLYRYDKHHLVPFGEFIPPGFRWFTEMMRIPLGDFMRGPLAPPSFEVRSGSGGSVWVAPHICYEDLFGEELAQRFRDPATAPGLLVNVSNIAWFGNTVAIPQHLQIARMRAMELQRPIVRATNTGATAVIDHSGRVTDKLAPYTRGVLQGVVQSRQGLTPYVSWVGPWGLLPAWGLAVSMILVLRRWRPEPAQPAQSPTTFLDDD